MAITVIPATTYAMEEFENDYEFSADEVSIKYEIESKRTENSKTYMTEDGGYYQVSAAVPIHNNVNGQWQEISEIDNNIDTISDAENAVSELLHIQFLILPKQVYITERNDIIRRLGADLSMPATL